MELCDVGCKRDGLSVRGDSLLKLALVHERDAKVAVCLCEIGLDRDGLGDETDGNLVLVRLKRENAKEMLRNVIAGLRR